MNNSAKKIIAMKRVAKIVAPLFASLFFAEAALSSQNQDWLAVERVTSSVRSERIDIATKLFDDVVVNSLAISRDVRSMMSGANEEFNLSVNDLETSVEISADAWVQGLPKSNENVNVKTLIPDNAIASQTECRLNFENGNYECSIWSAKKIATTSPQVTILAPTKTDVEQNLGQLPDEVITDMLGTTPVAATVTPQKPKNIRNLKFFRGAAGLVTTDGGKISFSDAQETVAIQMAPEVKKKHISMFVRDPSLLAYDGTTNQLRALNVGNTELFVVSKDRISIIPVSIAASSMQAPVSIASKSKGLKDLSSKARDLDMPASLASVDTLDRAASEVHASYGSLANEKSSPEVPSDLQVPSEMTSLETSDDKTVAFVRAKAKATFGKMFVRVVDERSQWDLSRTYPVGGVRVKLIGTEFESRTDGQGFLEIPEIPAGARVFAEIVNDSGATMPGFAEITFDASAMSREHAQAIMVRRYLSLDYAARMAGVVQNMEKASLCATAVDSSAHRKSLAGIRLSSNHQSIGPFYFNELGYLDTRMASTGSNGRFCFFNVEPGAVALGIQKAENPIQVAVLMTARGRHSEEVVGLDDARHLTTTVASVATAGDQLSSDVERANRYLSVEQAEVTVVGGRDQMVPIDEGVYTSGNPVIPVRGRVWTVATSSDFETSLQASSIRLPGSRQITSLLPRGFVDDMANYAQQNQDPDLGTVVVEHSAIAGQGTESVKIRLVDPSGHDVGDGWYFADNPIAKAVFFNVPPGVYSVVVETSSGQWLAADTLMTDAESSTYVRTGAPLEKHLTVTSAEN